MTTDLRRICFVICSRAEYESVCDVLVDLRSAGDCAVQLIVGLDGIAGEAKDNLITLAPLDPLVSEPAARVARRLVAFAQAIAELRPSLMVAIGDSLDVFAAAQAALVARVRLVHVVTPSTTSGAWNEAVLHSITKLAYVHIVPDHRQARRAIKMGEAPDRVHLVRLFDAASARIVAGILRAVPLEGPVYKPFWEGRLEA